MAKWEKKDNAKTVWDVIKRNTGLTKQEFFAEKEYEIKGLDELAEYILNAIKNKTPISIVGDYDADGITASAIMATTLNHLGTKPRIRLPRRISEGFGLSETIVDEINEGIIITVDNGIAAVDAVKKAKEKGLTVIITDHHLPNDDNILPDADFIINPHLPGTADFTEYCGAGIAYKLCCKLTDDEKIKAIISGFAAIGTVADMMPILYDNRKIVIEGLKNLVNPETRTTGMGAILEICNLNNHITTTNISFKIGPILNAAGRLYDNGAMISLTAIAYNGSYEKALELAENLIHINEERKEYVSKTMEEAYLNISTNCLYGDNPLCLYIPNMSEGIVGIIAGRLAEEMKVSSIVLTDSEQPGILKGSARGYGEVNIKDVLDANKHLLVKYGGHAGAAGLSVKKEDFMELKDSLINYVDKLPIAVQKDVIYYDLDIVPADIPKMINEQKKYEPYGFGNPKPIFRIEGFELFPRYSEFYKLKGQDNSTITLYGQYADATGFGMAEKYNEMNRPKRLNIIGIIGENHFMGKVRNEVEIIDKESNVKIIEKTSLASLLEKKALER